jgi:hypothetical protein
MLKSLTITLVLSFAFILPAKVEAQTLPAYVVLYKTAKKRFAAGKYGMALDLFLDVKESAIKAGTYNEMIDYRIGLCYEKLPLPNYSKAISHFQIYLRAKSIKPSWPSKASIKIKIKGFLGKVKKPAKVVKHVVRTNTSLAATMKTYYANGISFYNSKYYAAALTQFYKAARYVRMSKTYFPMIYINIAVTLVKKYETSKRSTDLYYAIRNYKRYLKETTTVMAGWPTKAMVNAAIGKVEFKYQQMKIDKQALRKQNALRQFNNKLSMGYSYYNAGRYKDAIRQLKSAKYKSRRIKKYTYLIDYYIAESYYQTGNYKYAIKHFNIYLKAPRLEHGWQSKQEIRRRVQVMNNYLYPQRNAGYSNTYSTSSTSYSSTGPRSIDGGEPGTFMGIKWYWWLAGGVGLALLVIIANGNQESETTGTYKINSMKVIPKPVGFTIFKF